MQKRWNGLKKCVTLHKYIYLKWEETVIEVKSKEMQKRRQLFLLYVSVARDQKRPFVCSFYFQAAPLFVSALFAFVTISYLLVLFLYSCFFFVLSLTLTLFLSRSFRFLLLMPVLSFRNANCNSCHYVRCHNSDQLVHLHS